MVRVHRQYDFERAVGDYIAAHGLLRDGATVIVALSGGADSVALLAVLTALGYRCVAAHCNFHLRGDESQRDMRHAQAVADALDVDLSIKNFDVPARMAATGESVEMACRALRYAWFADLLEHEHAQAIAVGHHREDQAETLLLNALRGTGIAGLAGMQPRNGHIVRPMLDCTRAQILDYLHDRGLEFVTDSTNADSAFKRNHLRNNVLPVIGERFADPVGALARTAAHVADNLALYNLAVAELGRRYTRDDGSRIDVAAMRAAMPGRVGRMLLFEILKPLGYNYTQAANIFDAAADTTAQFAAADTVATLSRGIVRLRARTGSDIDSQAHRVSLRADIVVPLNITVTERDISAFRPARDAGTAYLDCRVLEGDPVFEIRRWRRGDRMRPFGMTGTKLVSDIMAGARYTPEQKNSIWLLTRNGQILWAIGLRASALYAVTPVTRSFIELRLDHPEDDDTRPGPR